MNKNRFLLILSVVSLLLVTMAVSRPSTVPNSAGANDFYQRHRDWNRNLAASDYYERHPEQTVSTANVNIPVTGMLEASDFFQRHPELVLPAASTPDLSDYFVRHPDLRNAETTTDLSDYHQRH